jgi:hypothetical protein
MGAARPGFASLGATIGFELQDVRSRVRSERRPGLPQQLEFLGSSLAPKGCIPVGKTSETGDHLAVAASEVGEPRELRFSVPPSEQAQALVLVREAFTMLERQIKEGRRGRRNLPIETVGYRAPRSGTREVIGRERPRSIAKHVPRKLVEQNHEGQASERVVPPAFQLAANRLLEDLDEPRAHVDIESRCLREPALLEFRRNRSQVISKPETQDFAEARIGAGNETIAEHALSSSGRPAGALMN